MTRPRRTRGRDPLVAGLLVLALFVGGLALALGARLPFGADDGREFVAEFPTARQVDDKTPVRVRGVDVGRVESARYDAARRVASVRFTVTDADLDLRADASAALRWRTLLGGRMELALDPGHAAAALRGPIRRTRIQAELEDVTRVLQGDGGDGLRATLRELPEALRGPSAGDALDALPRLRSVAPALRAIRGERDGDLRRLVLSTSRVAAAADRAREALGTVVAGAERTFATTARDAAKLRATLERSPAALDATTGAAHELRATLPGLDRLVRALRPGARDLGPTLAVATPTVRRLRTVLAAARPLVRDLRPAVAELADAATSGRAVLDGLDPTIRRAADDLVPWLERRDDDLDVPVYALIPQGITAAGAPAGNYTSIGHVFNFPFVPSEGSQTFLPCSTFFTDPSAAEKVSCSALNDALQTLLGGTPPRRRR